MGGGISLEYWEILGAGLSSCVVLVLGFVFSSYMRSSISGDYFFGVWEVEWTVFVLDGSGGRVKFGSRSVCVCSGSFSPCLSLYRCLSMPVS